MSPGATPRARKSRASSPLSKPQSSRANHWVALTSPVTYSPDGKNVSFDVFSWGKTYHVDTTTHVVELRFHGYVVGY